MSDSGEFRRQLPEAKSDIDEQILANIDRLGWQVLGIPEDDEGPAFAYSVGMYHTFEHPEFVLFGLPLDFMQAIINLAGEEIRKGKRYQDWHQEAGLLEGYLVCFREVPKTQYREYLGYNRWLYQGDDFPALQCVWPDKLHHFPWHPDSSEAFQERQPLICEQDDWPFATGKNTVTYVSRSIFTENKPILLVHHEANGEWQFLTHEPVQGADMMIVGLGAMLDHDASLREIADLPEGHQATRKNVGSIWILDTNPST